MCKLIVLDLSVSGRQIGEKIFNMLNAEQQHDLVDFIMDIEKLVGRTTDIPCVSLPRQVAQDNIEPLTKIQIGDLYFCPEERRVCVQGQSVELTAKEFDALHLLIINQKRVITFEIIAYRVWGEEYIDITPKTIHNLMSRLRQKLQVDSSGPEYVKSVRGVGYKFEA